MHGRRSLNLELTLLDLDLERNIRRARRTHAAMEANPRNASRKITKMQELGMGSKDEHMTWISLRHYGNCSHQLRLVPIRA
jgi:hypothetical protein